MQDKSTGKGHIYNQPLSQGCVCEWLSQKEINSRKEKEKGKKMTEPLLKVIAHYRAWTYGLRITDYSDGVLVRRSDQLS